MKYDVYFHNDFDGRASAALMLHFLRERGDDIEHFVPVNYDLIPQWLDEHFFEKHKLFKGKHNPAIIVDFLYHPKAAFWFEHHPTTFKKESWQKNFKPSKYHNFITTYPSCCHLVYDSLKNNFGWRPPRYLTELMEWLDIIDGARYRSARQTIEMKEPALMVDAFIETNEHSPKSQKWLIDLLARKPLAAIARMPEVKKAVEHMRKRNEKGAEFFEKRYQPFRTGAFIDIRKTKLEPPHFYEPYRFPENEFSVRLSIRDGLNHIRVGRNPWLSGKPRVHIGELLRKYGGGGHQNVGGVEFRSARVAEKAAKEIIAVLDSVK